MDYLGDTESFCIDESSDWDINLFDELVDLGDANELLTVLGGMDYVPDLDFDMDLPSWRRDSSSAPTDADVTAASLSPAPTLSPISSPNPAETLSPYSSLDEALSPQSQASPLSMCSDSSGFSEVSPEIPPQPLKKTKTQKAKQVKRPIQMSTKVSIQPRPLVTVVPFPTVPATTLTPLQAKTIILQPLPSIQPALPSVEPAQVVIQPAPPATHPVILPQPAQVFQVHTASSIQSRVISMPTLAPESQIQSSADMSPGVKRMPQNSINASDEDSSTSRRQMRMIKNRESASLSRKKKREYLLTLEARLKVALTENAQLKSENGTLKKQLHGLVSENAVLKTTAPKRRAVCLLVLVVFLVFNLGPIRLHTDSDSSREPIPGTHTGRHLLEITADTATPEDLAVSKRSEDVVSEEKALMVVRKSSLIVGATPPCQPFINRTKCIKLAHELRGWVHRHEVEHTKNRRHSNTQIKSRTILKETNGKEEVSQHLPIQYADSTKRISGNELQVYYAPHRTYQDFFEEINRRGDTFYVISFRRDHLLLPATSHNKGSRPKMSVVLPAMNMNDSVIDKDKEFEVMMQIDCEVMDTRILHIKSSSIPPVLRTNQSHSETYYQPNQSTSQAATVGVLVGSA